MEYIYLLTNPFMPGLVKIGKTTTHPNQRIGELKTTGVPGDFEIECAFVVDDCTRRERVIHQALSKYRIPKREFFQIEVDAALRVILPLLGSFTIHEAKSTHRIEALDLKLREQEERERLKREERDRYARLKAETERNARQAFLLRKAEREAEVKRQMDSELVQLDQWYERTIESELPKAQLLSTSISMGFVTLVALVIADVEKPAFVVKAVIAGALIGGWALKKFLDHMRLRSQKFSILQSRYQSAREKLFFTEIDCANCLQHLRLKRYQFLVGSSYLEFDCPRCGNALPVNGRGAS